MDEPQPTQPPYTPPVTPPPPTPQPPVASPVPAASHTGLLLGILAALVVLAAAAYYFLVMKPGGVAVVSPSPSASTTPTSNPTAGWQTYSNSNVGIQFMMPPQWVIEAPGQTHLTEATVFDPTLVYGTAPDAFSPGVTVTAYADTWGGSISEYEKTLAPPGIAALRQLTTEIIGGKTAYVYRGTPLPGKREFWVVFANGKVYNISNNSSMVSERVGTVEAEKLEQIFKALLTTFKFTP